jgi:hypothetical protein
MARQQAPGADIGLMSPIQDGLAVLKNGAMVAPFPENTAESRKLSMTKAKLYRSSDCRKQPTKPLAGKTCLGIATGKFPSYSTLIGIFAGFAFLPLLPGRRR